MRNKSLLHKVLLLNVVAIAATIILSGSLESLARQFEDGGFITYFSVVQLLIIAYLAYQVFKTRSPLFKHPWRSSITIWALISFGFFFLALDDLLMIHEGIDKAIHQVGQFQETGLSDRIDDLIVGGYGLVAIGLIALYRKELKKYKAAFPYVVIGFVLLFVMVGIDVVTNRDDILLAVFSPQTTEAIMSWIIVPEEGTKLISEGFFIVAIDTCRQIANQIGSQPITRQVESVVTSPILPHESSEQVGSITRQPVSSNSSSPHPDRF